MSRLRAFYDAFEDLAAPLVHDVVRSEEFAQIATTLGRVNKGIRNEFDRLAARAWHAVNLPAGTDVKRLRTQVGALDREVRLLALELERAGREAKRGGQAAR